MRRLIVLALTVVACGSSAATPVPTPSPSGSLGSAATASASPVLSARPTTAPATTSPPKTPSPTPTLAAAPTASSVRSLAPSPAASASSPAPSLPLASLDDRVRVVSVETVDERTRDLLIETPSLPEPVGVRLLLPAGFDAQPDRRWPVLYLLHGAGLDQEAFRAWTYNTDVQALVAATNLLVVMPQGDGFGWYSDWWNGGDGGPPKWETFHLVELLAILERDWRAGGQRAIAGLSMGGYGAMVYAARHPGMFKAAASYSGPLDILGEKDSGLLGNDVATWGDPVDQIDIWRAHNPIDLAESLRGTALYISFGDGGQGPLDTGDPGDDGEAFRSIGNRAFVARLEELNIPATVDAYGPGSHSWPYFERALHRSLPLLLTAVGEGR